MRTSVHEGPAEGFTLIELLVVVLIIGILSAIAVPAFLNQRERAWQSALTSLVRNVALEAEAMATATNGDYEDGLGGAPADVLVTVQGIYGGINGGVTTDPIVITTADADVDSFAFCARHVSILSAHNVTYDSDAGGLQDFADGAACPANIAP